jgi:hypothetical protein
MGVGAVVGIVNPLAANRAQTASVDPFQMMNQMADFRQKQYQFQAQQRAGQIISQSPDLPTAINSIRQDPEAGWMLPYMQSMYEMGRTNAETNRANAQTQQVQFDTGIHALQVGAANAAAFGKNGADGARYIRDAPANLNPETQREVSGPMNDIATAMADGNPDRAGMAQRLTAWMLASGAVSPGQAYGAFQSPPPQVVEGFDPSGARVSIPYGGSLGPIMGGTQAGGAPATGAGAGFVGAPGTAPPAGTGTPSPYITRGPSTEEAEYQKAAGPIQDDVIDTQRYMPVLDNRLNMMLGAMKNVRFGPGSNFKQTLEENVRTMREAGVPVPESWNNIIESQLPDRQLFKSLLSQFATETMKEATLGTGAGRIKAEVDTFLKSMSPDMMPQSLFKLIYNSKRTLEQYADQADGWVDFKNNVGTGEYSGYRNAADYYDWWRKNRKDVVNAQVDREQSEAAKNIMGTDEWQKEQDRQQGDMATRSKSRDYQRGDILTFPDKHQEIYLGPGAGTLGKDKSRIPYAAPGQQPAFPYAGAR